LSTPNAEPVTHVHPPAHTAHAGEIVLERYRLVRRIGAGGMGVVYLAVDEHLEREVAVKRIAVELDPDGRGEREAIAAARLSHPGIVALYESGRDEDAVYLVSELVRGRTLADLIREGELSDRDVVRIGVTLCDALEHAHARGVIHRDVKPSNVICADSPDEGGGVAKLTDFGIALMADGDVLTRTGDIMGTLAYMAPEQARGKGVTGAADIYALGVVLYEGLAGVNPIRAGSPAATASRIGKPLPALQRVRRDLPPDLCRAIDGAVIIDPQSRASLGGLRLALLHAVDRVADDAGPIATEAGVAQTARQLTDRRVRADPEPVPAAEPPRPRRGRRSPSVPPPIEEEDAEPAEPARSRWRRRASAREIEATRVAEGEAWPRRRDSAAAFEDRGDQGWPDGGGAYAGDAARGSGRGGDAPHGQGQGAHTGGPGRGRGPYRDEPFAEAAREAPRRRRRTSSAAARRGASAGAWPESRRPTSAAQARRGGSQGAWPEDARGRPLDPREQAPPVPVARRLRLRVPAAAAAGALAGGALAWLGPAPPVQPAIAAIVAGLAVLVLPRLGWIAMAGWLLVWLAATDPGIALLVFVAAAPVPLLLPRKGVAWSLPAAAPLLGLAGLAGAWPAIAGQARGLTARASLGALGGLWLVLAETLTGERLLTGQPRDVLAAGAWHGSVLDAGGDALAPLLSGGTLAIAALWALAAAVLPLLVRGRSPALDLVAATGWAATLAAATQAIAQGLVLEAPRGLVAGALASAAIAVGARAARGRTGRA
jgi:hypothetical protein